LIFIIISLFPGREYSNGTAFCEAQNIEVVDGAPCFEYDPDVFGSATMSTVNLVLFCVLLSLALLDLLQHWVV
jgi:hypothetical protein